MKKIIVWIITLMFFVAFAFTAIKVNAAEIGKEYVYESEEGIVYITLIDETNAKIYVEIYEGGLKAEMLGVYKISQEVENAIDFYAVSEINGEVIHDYWNTFVLNEDGTAEEYFEVDNTPTTDDNTQEEVDKVPTIVEQKTKEITDYVIALVVSFLGSSAFYAIVKAITSHGSRILKDKISELEKQNQISQKAKEIYEAKIADLENTLVDATEKIDVVLEQFTKYLELDEAKQKQAAELLQKLLPPVDNNDNKKEGE
jgi:hypothetical protein